MSAEKNISVVAHSRGKLFLAWLVCFWKGNLASAFFCWAFVTWIAISALDGNLRPNLVRPVANAIGVPVALLSCAGIVWRWASRLSSSHLSIDGAEVIFRAHVAWRGMIERRYQLNELASVILGQPLNALECVLNRINGVELAVFLKEGRLLVTDIYGERVTFQFMNMAFDLALVQAFVVELSHRNDGAARPTEFI